MINNHDIVIGGTFTVSRMKRNTGCCTMDCKLVSGQHVLCIDDGMNAPKDFKVLTPYVSPKSGTVYTVGRIDIGFVTKAPVIVVDEIGEQIVRVLYEGEEFDADVLWPAKYFKPLDPIKVEDFFEQVLTHPKILDTV